MSQIADMHFPKHRKVKLAEVGKIIADYDPNGDERENLVDLLTDVMHWCEGFGEPFQEFGGTARCTSRKIEITEEGARP